MNLIIGLLTVILFSIFITSLFNLRDLISQLLTWYITGMANVILVSEIAGLFNQVDNPLIFLGLHLLLAIIAIVLWVVKGKPMIFGAYKSKVSFQSIKESIKSDPLLWILSISVIGAYLVNALLIIVVHANNNDSLAVHLARIGYWLQFGSFKPWPTANYYQISYPFNAQVQMFWTVLLSGTDQLVEFVQWFSAVFAAIAITGIGKLLGYTRKQSVFSGLIWASLPLILLQSTTTQNDLISASVVIIGLYYLFLGIKRQKIIAMILSGLALGIALGIKQTAFFVLPGLAITLFLVYLKYKKQVIKFLLYFLIASFCSLLLFGSYIYISNFIYYKNPFGPSDYVEKVVNIDKVVSISKVSNINPLIINSSRYLYQVVDPTGLPLDCKDDFVRLKQALFSKLFSLLNIPVESDIRVGHHQFLFSEIPLVHEDVSWFGLLGFVLIFLSIIELIKAIRKRNVFSIGLIMIAFSAFFGVILFRGTWTPYHARYMISSFTFLAPFFSIIYRKREKQSDILIFIIVLLIVAFAVTSMANVIINNAGKPVRSLRTVLFGDRLDHYKFQGGYLVKVVSFVNDYVPKNATLGLAIGRSWEYPFFGENFTRELIPIYPISNLNNREWVSDQGIEYILVDQSQFEDYYLPEYCTEIGSFDEYIILHVNQ
jgi:4-amino-4-deoxy-L-arabinose transferase-like glycosyltransferase